MAALLVAMQVLVARRLSCDPFVLVASFVLPFAFAILPLWTMQQTRADIHMNNRVCGLDDSN